MSDEVPATGSVAKRRASKKAAAASEAPEAASKKAPARKAAKPRGDPITLVICEKQIAAERIAEILSDGKRKTGGKGPIRIFSFQRAGKEWRVVGLSGHVVEVDYPSELNRWYQVNPRDLIHAEPIKKVPRDSKKIVNALAEAAKGADEVIVATDFDREGELIGKEGVELLQDQGVRVRRARFSSLTAKEVKSAFDHLVDLDENLAAAGKSRQWVDLAWGAVLTRIITMAARQPGREVLSVGRVQSPTLALIVDREKEIRAFKPQDYWEITAELGDPSFHAWHLGPAKRAAETEAPASKDVEVEGEEEEASAELPATAFPDEAEAQRVYDAIRNESTARVASVARTKRIEPAPTPFNTTTFQQAAATGLGITPARAMQIAEELYMRGYISYPRTDNTVYPPTEDLNAIVADLEKAGPFAKDVAYLRAVRRPQPTRGKKEATDHPPIHPVEAARRDEIPEDAWRVYELVVRRFLATLAQDAQGENIKADIEIKQEPFRATGYRVEFWGWKRLYDYTGSAERPLPDLREGSSVPVNRVDLTKKQTTGPKRYGQARLIALMEKLGLGTKSTRHDIIDKLLGRRYVNGPRTLEPTEIGFAVTDALERYAEVITKPDMTAHLEEEMELVAQGKKTFEEVVADSRQLLDQAVTVLERNRTPLSDALYAALLEQNTVGKCPQCGKALRVLRSRIGKRFVGCSGYPECRQTYPLPQQGRLVPMNQACPACTSPMVKILTAGRPPWEICINMECPARRPKDDAAPPAEAPRETA